MEDVDRLREELEDMSPEDRERRIRQEQVRAASAEAVGAADPEARAALEGIARNLERLKMRDVGVMRAELVGALADRLHERAHAEFPETTTMDISTLAEALNHVDLVWRREQANPPTPSPSGITVDALAARVWNATQEAGAPTAAGDAAVAVLREAFGAGT